MDTSLVSQCKFLAQGEMFYIEAISQTKSQKDKPRHINTKFKNRLRK